MTHSATRFGALVLVLTLACAGCSGAEARKQSFIAAGQKHMAAHDWQKARIEFRNALQIDPKDRSALLLAAEASERAGEYRDALSIYEVLLGRDKTDHTARANLARLYGAGGLPAEAIRLAEEGLAAAPGDAALLTGRGIAHAARGAEDLALADAEAALAQTPTDPDAAILAASMYVRRGREEEARTVLGRASRAAPDNVALHIIRAQVLANAGRVAEAERAFLEAVRIEPRELQHRYRLAQFHVLQKNVDAAEKTLRGAIAQAPDETGPKLALAELIAAQRSFQAGEQGLRDLVAADPKDAALRMGLGRFYEAHQHPAEAAEVYRALIRDEGTDAQGLAARNRLAALALAANRALEAGGLIAEVLEASPRDADALTMRAGIALERGDTTAAIADLRALLRDQPNSGPLLRTLARAYAANKDIGLAEETLRNAMRASPGDVATRQALADLLVQNGRGDEARPIAEQLLVDRPGDLRALEAAFRIQVQRRDLVAARRTAQSIKTLRPDLPNGHHLEGLVEEADGKPELALAALEQALKRAPGALEPTAAAVRIELARRRGEQALARIDASLARAPTSAGLVVLQSEAQRVLGRAEQAAQAANRAIALAPAWMKPYQALAAVELGRKRPEAAIAAYRKGIESAGAAPDLILQLALIYERLGRIDEAMGLYDDWLEREPGSEVASNNAAMLLLTHRAMDPASLDRAAALAQRLQTSTRPAFIDTLGWVHYVRGEYALAVAALQRAVDAAPNVAMFRLHLGLAQSKAGQGEAARVNLEQGLAGAAGAREAAEARAALQGMRAAR